MAIMDVSYEAMYFVQKCARLFDLAIYGKGERDDKLLDLTVHRLGVVQGARVAASRCPRKKCWPFRHKAKRIEFESAAGDGHLVTTKGQKGFAQLVSRHQLTFTPGVYLPPVAHFVFKTCRELEEACAVKAVAREEGKETYTCPITLAPIVKPVCVETGDVFEEEALREWFQSCTRLGVAVVNPMTNATLGSVCYWNVPIGLFHGHDRRGTVTSKLKPFLVLLMSGKPLMP
jgi:hypothetical protein